MVRVSHSRSVIAERAARRRRRLRRVAWIALLGPVVGLLLLAAALGIFEPVQNAMMRRSGATTVPEVLRALVSAPIHFVRASAVGTPPLRLGIDIKFKHLYKMHQRRAEALESGRLVPVDEDFVPASIDVAGQTIRVRVRLAGGSARFLEGDKWPLDVRLRGEGHVFGMRRFVLRPPEQRGFQTESLFLAHLREHDVLAPRFHFVDISLNGKDIGLMAIEEYFSREMLESQQRRDGPVLQLLPASKDERRRSTPRTKDLQFDPTIAPVRPLEVEGSKTLERNFDLANKMLRAYLVGVLTASDVFDVEQTARFLAIAELWGARNALEWRNLRFYFNPLTARLEPVGYGAELSRPEPGAPLLLENERFIARLLEDPRLRTAVRDALHSIAEEMQGDSFAQALERQQRWLFGQLHREYPMRIAFALEPLLERIESIRTRDALPDLEIALPTIQTRGKGLAPLPETTIEQVLAQHPFLRWDAESRTFRGERGRWEVDGSLILPRGAGLDLVAGTILHFEKREGIIARGPLRFIGSEAEPVVLEGPSNEERSRLWSGVYVIESDRESTWSHVAVRNTGGFKRGDWRLAGGVVFRKARVTMRDTMLRRNRTDDSLNIIRSEFALDRVTIHDATSDAFDADYASGYIRDGEFEEAGGDGIDCGGSSVRVDRTRLRNIRDKALVVGEHSQVEANEIEIDRAGIGVASKNGGRTHLTNSKIVNVTDVALAAYFNRAQFGPGRLTVSDTTIEAAARTAVAQTGSEIVIDGRVVPPVNAAIERLHKDSDLDRQGAY